MTEISTNYATGQVQNQSVSHPEKHQYIKTKELPPDEFWRREKRKDSGLMERMYNAIKNALGLGVGSKKVEQALEQAKNGEISTEEFKKKVHDYNASQENSAQLLGDGASVAAAGFSFFWLNKAFKYSNAWALTNKPLVKWAQKMFDVAKDDIAKTPKPKSFLGKLGYNMGLGMMNLSKTMIKTLSSNKKMTAIAAGLAGLAGGYTKYWTLKFNRAGSDEFEIDKQIYGKRKDRDKATKKAVKAEKKRLNKERNKTNFKNFVSGTINGLMMPVFALGGIIGAPLYLVGNSLNRYFVANKTDKNKSAGGYVENLAKDGITTGLFVAGAAIPLIKKGNYTKIFNENIAKVAKKLGDAELKEAEFKGISAYKRLETELLGNSKIKSIMEDGSISIDEQIRQLTKENIFAVKFKQISDDGTMLTRALKDKCPPTRTLEQAQHFVDTNLGGGYKLSKLLGVGTVAETYLAKSPEGKEVCIKVLKDGISKEKIAADKEKFAEMIRNMKDKSADEKDYLLRNIDDLADGISKEVNLQNEMDNAIKLAKSTKAANVVKPICVKNNIYVMEKAKGVNLASFMDLNKLYIEKESAERLLKGEEKKAALEKIEKEIERIQSRMPGFEKIKLTKADTDFILREYQKVYIEQFHKVDKNGKIIHADLHEGNVLIDPDVLKTRKGKLFTLLDTGNMIDIGVEQSMRALNFSKYIEQGNVKDIAAFVLDGAKLPKNMTKEQALEKVTKELETCFFDSKTKIGMLNDEKVLTLTDNIMQKYDIIPSSTQLNLNKSRTSARNSLHSLQEAINNLDSIKIIAEFKDGNKLKGTAKTGMKGLELVYENKAFDSAIKQQEKQNLKQLSVAEQLKQKNNPNAPKTNSEEYITYKLKQYKDDSKLEEPIKD